MATRHFTDAELRCKCPRHPIADDLPPQEFQDDLEELRRTFGRPMVLSSGKRCPAHNAEESRTGSDGPHTRGAADVRLHGREARELVQAAAAIGLVRALREMGLAAPQVEAALRDPAVIRRSVELAWGGLGISQRGDRGRRFVHLDGLPGPTRPWIWSY